MDGRGSERRRKGKTGKGHGRREKGDEGETQEEMKGRGRKGDKGKQRKKKLEDIDRKEIKGS